jgi:CheY-like chemotaxis protein
VLVVEDDADIRSAIADLLHDEGYECIVAEHGVDALEVLGRQTPSLVITDLLMPLMNGVELIGRLRSDARWSALPVVVMTAQGQHIIGVDLESLRVPILQKPVDIARLAKVLAEHSTASGED